MDFINNFVDALTTVCSILNFILYLYSWIINKKSKELLFLFLYLTSLLVTHLITNYTYNNGINNFFVSHYYFGLQFLFLGLFYRSIFLEHQKKWVTIILVVVFILLAYYYCKNPEKYYEFNLIDIFTTTAPLIIFSIIHLYNMLTQKNRFFYINAGVLIYLSTSTLIFFLGTITMTDNENKAFSRETALNIWNINNFLYLFYLLFFVFEWKKTISKWKHKIS